MSKLGECLGYVNEKCPNCGRMRVEYWSCGKRICEKCHWCIEDQEYYYEELEDDESYIDHFNFGESEVKGGES